MFGIMGLSALFSNAARAKKQVNMLSFISGDEDLSIWNVSCDGEIIVKTIKGGVAQEVTYTNLFETTVALENDANTKVEIVGNVTEIRFYNEDEEEEEQSINITSLIVKKCKTLTLLQCCYCTGLSSLDLSANTALTYLDCLNCTGLSSLDLSANTKLTALYCKDCTGLSSLDLSANTALTTLDCRNCTGLSSLDLSANTALTYLDCSLCTGLSSIYYPATNSSVATEVANAITAADADNGTVYTDSEGAYYSTIETAATTKGWTIEQLA